MAIKKNKGLKGFCALAILLVFASCGMQKRLYTKGFYTGKHQTVKTQAGPSEKDTLPNVAVVPVKKQSSKLLASNTSLKSKDHTDILSQPNIKLTEGCDTIFLRSGARIVANISEVNLTKILFKNCGSTDESIVFIKKTDVSYIVYANGNKEVFEADDNTPSNLPSDRDYDRNANSQKNTQNSRSNNYEQSSGSHKMNAFALISFIMSAVPYPFILILAAILGLGSLINHSNVFSLVFGKSHFSPFLILPVLLVLAALVLSILAIYQIKNNGDVTKKGLKLAYIALILSIGLLILLLAFIF